MNDFLRKYKSLVSLNILAISIAGMFLVVPSVSQANEVEALKVLHLQVQVLSREVEKLVEQVSELQKSEEVSPSPDEVRELLSQSVTWFQQQQEESGHFRYEYVPYEDRYLDDDNIVRQSGGLYALGEVLRQEPEYKEAIRETMVKSIEFFEGLSVEANVEGREVICVGNSVVNQHCQLGTTGLVLIGILDLIEVYPELEDKYSRLIDGYVQYLLAMKKDAAGFRNNFTPDAPLKNGESSFSNGETVLALIRYYKYDSTEEVKKVIDDTFEYLKNKEEPFDFGLYLWIMTALKDMYEVWPKEEYVTFTKEYTNWRLAGFFHQKHLTFNTCAYVEGLVGAYSVLENNVSDIEKKRILDEIRFWLRKLQHLQLTEEDTYRLISDEDGVSFGMLENPNQALGGFLTGLDILTQRIDFTQHCINSFLGTLVHIDGERL